MARAGSSKITRHQGNRLQAQVRYAYRHSTYYQTRFDTIGLRPESIRGIEDLARIPVTDKSALKAVPRQQLLSSDPALGPLTDERSSGSTGTPFSVAFDRDYLLNRNVRFLRGLWAAGYRWPMKLLLVTGAKEKPPSRWLRWHYVSIKVDAGQILQTLREVRPAVLYGCVSPLREIARLLLDRDEDWPPLRSVITTAETLDAQTRQLLQRVFRCDVFDFYGMTEMGLVGWECRAHEGYHLALDSVIVEQLPLAHDLNRSQLVYTNLALKGMPMLRYASGDIGSGYSTEKCRCGSRLPRLQRVEGRLVDAIVLPDGRRCSPYQFTCELELLHGLHHYRVIQEHKNGIRVLAVIDSSARSSEAELENDLERDIITTIHRITDPTMRVMVEFVPTMPPTPGSKFRIVEGRLPPVARSTSVL